MDKYEKAMELARNYYPSNLFLDTIFPELTESEDERTRTQLVDFLEHLHSQGATMDFDVWSKADCANWIVWLEKQKKQKPAERERMASCPTIKGWVARDSSPVNAQDLNIGKLKIWPKVPYRNKVGLFWMPNFPQDFAIMMLPSDLIPDLRWEDEPIPVRVIIEEIK